MDSTTREPEVLELQAVLSQEGKDNDSCKQFLPQNSAVVVQPLCDGIKTPISASVPGDAPPAHDSNSLNKSLDGNSAGKSTDAVSSESSRVPTNPIPASIPDFAAARQSFVRYKCDMCGRVCPSKHKLKRHLSTHSEARPFPCGICGRSFKWTEYLQKHMRQQHSMAAKGGIF